MRIHLNIEAESKIIPFDHQPLLTGTIHKWLGWNDEHGKISLYSFSQLTGGKVMSDGFKFDRESSFFFSAFEENTIKKLISGIQADPTMFDGLVVCEVIIQEDPDLSERTLFQNASPILLKRKVNEKTDHILYDDPRADICLKETLLTKLNKAGLTDTTMDIHFDRSYSKAGTKKITYKGIQNRANWCHVIIEGKPETKQFAWNVGLGNSTGIGFGAIK